MKAFILAGGEGTRLGPLTRTRPKPLVPLIDRPILDGILSHLRENGFDDIALLVGYRGQDIEQYAADGKEWQVHLSYQFDTGKPLGTAGSVIRALKRSGWDEPLLVVSGDGVTNLDLRDFYRRCQTEKAEAGILLSRVSDPRQYGLVTTDDSGKVTGFIEKPQIAVPDAWVNTGIYYFDPGVLRTFTTGISLDFGKDLFPHWVAENRRVLGLKTQGYWSDVGSFDQYRQTIFDLVRAKHDVLNTETGRFQRDPSLIIISPSVIDTTATIGRGAIIGPYAVIGRDAYIGDRCRISRSIIRPGTWIGANTIVHGAILAEHSFIGTAATIDKGSVIGDHSWIGSRAHLESNSLVWPSTVMETMPATAPTIS